MSVEYSYILILALIAIGSIQVSIENLLLFVRFPAIVNYPLDQGVLKSKLAKRFKFVYNSPGIWLLSITRLLAGLWLLTSAILSEIAFVPIILLLITDVFGFTRWKFLPSSDAPLQRFVLTGILIHILFNSKLLSEWVLIFISLLLCLTYFAAGLKKTKDENWKNGKTISLFFTNKVESSNLLKWLGYLVIFFECTFVFGLARIELAILFMVIGFLFHLYLYLKHGFNFFFWTFVAAYPAFYYTAEKFSSTIIEF